MKRTAALLALSVLAACGGGNDDTAATTTSTSTSTTSTSSTTTAPTTTAPPAETSAPPTTLDPETAPEHAADVHPSDIAEVRPGEGFATLAGSPGAEQLAAVWAWEYTAYPPNGTQQEWLDRLAPWTTPELLTALADSRWSDPYPHDKLHATLAGQVDPAGPNSWHVTGTTALREPSGEPIQGGHVDVAMIVTVTDSAPFAVRQISFEGGLTFP